MEIFTSLYFAVAGALNFVRYALWGLFPLATVLLLFARFGRSTPNYALTNFAWQASVLFLVVIGAFLFIGLLVVTDDRNFIYPVFMLLYVAGPALPACMISLFLRPSAPA